jgi:hypothetical protein
VTHIPDLDSPAARLKMLAQTVARLTVSRVDPERFHIDKSDVAGELRRLARELEIRPPLLRAVHVENIAQVGEVVRGLTGGDCAPRPQCIGSLPRQPHCTHCRRRRAAQSRRHRLRLPGIDLFQWADAHRYF